MTNEAPEHAAPSTPILPNGTYDALKWIAQIFLPALGTLYFGLAQIWGLAHAAEVVGTITVVDAFLGVLLGLSSRSYDKSDAKYDGVIAVSHREDGTKKADIILKNYENPADIVNQKQATFKVTGALPEGTEL